MAASWRAIIARASSCRPCALRRPCSSTGLPPRPEARQYEEGRNDHDRSLRQALRQRSARKSSPKRTISCASPSLTPSPTSSRSRLKGSAGGWPVELQYTGGPVFTLLAGRGKPEPARLRCERVTLRHEPPSRWRWPPAWPCFRSSTSCARRRLRAAKPAAKAPATAPQPVDGGWPKAFQRAQRRDGGDVSAAGRQLDRPEAHRGLLRGGLREEGRREADARVGEDRVRHERGASTSASCTSTSSSSPK